MSFFTPVDGITYGLDPSGNAAANGGQYAVARNAAAIPNMDVDGHLYPQTGLGGTAFLTIAQTCYLRYWGKATRAFTACKIAVNVTVAAAAALTWNEVAVFKTTTPPFVEGTTPGLTKVGAIAITVSTSTGIKTASITGMTIVPGDELWVACAFNDGTQPTMTAPQLDVFTSGIYASVASTRPTTATTIAPAAIATGLPALVAQFS